jgi:hypothetical protein
MNSPGQGANGIPPSFAKLVAAARSGDPDAMNMLGLAYLEESEVTRDENAAAGWFRKAAAAGHADGQFNYGWMLANGVGVPKSPGGALMWFRLAAKQGHHAAARLSGEQVSQGTRLVAGAEQEPVTTAPTEMRVGSFTQSAKAIEQEVRDCGLDLVKAIGNGDQETFERLTRRMVELHQALDEAKGGPQPKAKEPEILGQSVTPVRAPTTKPIRTIPAPLSHDPGAARPRGGSLGPEVDRRGNMLLVGALAVLIAAAAGGFMIMRNAAESHSRSAPERAK